MTEIEELNKEDLLKLLEEYNNYIVYFYDEHDYGSVPVGIYEFYNNEYQELND